MITQINLNNVTSYKNDVVIENLKKLNFFFGNNGTGKSTIAKYFNYLNNNQNSHIYYGNCSNLGYDINNHQVLVFDELFIKENFIDNNLLPGVFFLDKLNDKIQKEIQKEELVIEKYKNALDVIYTSKMNEIVNQKSELFEKKQTGILDVIFNKRDVFKKSFVKMNLKHSGNRINHFEEINNLLNGVINENNSFLELQNEYRDYYETILIKIHNRLDAKLYYRLRKLEININALLIEPFTGNKDVDIADMIDKLKLGKWIQDGLEKLNSTVSYQNCPFCQEPTITQDLISKFELYFDETFIKKKCIIEDVKDEYSSLTSDFLNNLKQLETEFKTDKSIAKLIFTIQSHFDNQLKIIQQKIDNTNDIKIINSISCFKDSLSNIISEVKMNNEKVEKLDFNKLNLEVKIWNYLAFESKNEIEKFNLDSNKLQFKIDAISRLTKIIKVKLFISENEVIKLRSQTINTTTAKNNINTILKGAGFTGFEIDEIDEIENNSSIPRYYLERLGENTSNVFNTLSEGEKNFISFLYFNEICKGDVEQEISNKKKIIVIDDPVSSLDNQSLFIVTSLIRELARKKSNSEKTKFFNENILQIFVLTHNIYFFKEVSFENGRKLCDDMSYYQIFKNTDGSEVKFSNKSNVDNDYNLLWKSLIRIKNNSLSTDNVIVGNLIRRILQSYLGFTKNCPTEWKLIEALPFGDPKRIIFSCLISQINDDSHHYNPSDEIYYQKITHSNLNEIFNVFELIFKDIGAEQHFNAMVEYSS